MKIVIEPFKIKSVEAIPITTPEDRELFIRNAFYNIEHLTSF